MASTSNFYADILPFHDFEQVTDLSNFRAAPEDWFVVVADIESSTQAITEGRYKVVNMAGAACITAVLNVGKNISIPYVFGGDGATMAVPPQLADATVKVLNATRQLVKVQFGLELRVGLVAVETIRGLGADFLVGKFQLSPGNYLAVFSGGGAELADGLVKSRSDLLYQSGSEIADSPLDLEGLSCRWETLHSTRGVMLSMLVNAKATTMESAENVYRTVLEGLADILGNKPSGNSPVTPENLIFRWPPRGLALEIKATQRDRNRFLWTLYLYAESFLQYLLEKFDKKFKNYDAPVYREELRANTDFRRFDDTLRLIIDCSDRQAEAIAAFLEKLHAEGRVRFGLHRTDRALMTCLVFDLARSEHIHFIDGADGGFAVAAQAMKKQV